MRNRIVVAGGSGFIGRLLTDRLVSGNNDVIVLTRSPGPVARSIRQVGWEGRTLGEWARELDSASALINLAGRSVNCRYNDHNRREILESRVDSTRVLGEAIARCNKPPPVWLNASTATIYKHTFDQPMDEATGVIGATPEAKDAFSIEVARAWEETLDEAPSPGHTEGRIANRDGLRPRRGRRVPGASRSHAVWPGRFDRWRDTSSFPGSTNTISAGQWNG